MDSPKLLADDLWCLMQSDPDVGGQFQLEEAEESCINEDGILDPISEEASSSSSELADYSSVWPVQHQVIRANCTARLSSDLQHQVATAKKSDKLPNLSSPPSSSCLGKRDRNNELKGKPSSKERSVVVKESKWAVQLLIDCVEAIASSNIQRTQHLMWVLNDLGSLTGDANQRLAAYGLKALYGKISGTPAPGTLNSAPKNLHNALLRFHDLHPWHQIVYSASIGALLDAFEGRKEIHVIDVGISQGTQWPTLIEALATRPTGPPDILRLTILEDPCSGICTPSSSAEVKNRLERFANVMGLNMELRVLSLPLDHSVSRESLQLSQDEAVAVCAHFRLSTISNMKQEEEEAGSARDTFLKLLHDELQPELMILGGNDLDNSSPEFTASCREVLEHHWRFLDSMNSAFKGQDCEERQIIEHLVSNCMIQAIARDDLRYEGHEKWSQRMRRAGFVADALQDEATETVRMLVKKNDPFWELRNEDNCLVLLWKHQPVTFCSVWRSSL